MRGVDVNSFLLPATTPLVTRSPLVTPGTAIIIDGPQFEDGRRRIVAPADWGDDVVKAVELVLREVEHDEGRARWLADLLTKTPPRDGIAPN